MVMALSFGDVFKKGFLENFQNIEPWQVAIGLILSLGLGILIYFVYKFTFSGVLYSKSLGFSFVMMSLITTLAIMAVSSNVMLSLGMVGALSIVRFRTAIKEPLDIAFLFWSIAVGIVLAAGIIPLAVFGSIIIGVILIVFVNKKTSLMPYIIVLSCAGHDAETKANDFIRSKVNRFVVKSKSVQKENIELNIEIRLKDDNTDFINELADMDGIKSAVLVSYNGEYMG